MHSIEKLPGKSGTDNIIALLFRYPNSSALQVHHQLLIHGRHMAAESVASILSTLTKAGLVRSIEGKRCCACHSSRTIYRLTGLGVERRELMMGVLEHV